MSVCLSLLTPLLNSTLQNKNHKHQQIIIHSKKYILDTTISIKNAALKHYDFESQVLYI